MALENKLKPSMDSEGPEDQQDPQESGEAEDSNQASKSETIDLKIAVLLGERLLKNGGFDVIQKAVDKSSNPGQVIGQFLLQMITQMVESMPDGIKLSPSILLAKNGWVEQISDYIQETIGTPKDIMDKAEIYIATIAQQKARANAQQAAGGQPPVDPNAQAAPADPSQGQPTAAPVMPQPVQGGQQ